MRVKAAPSSIADRPSHPTLVECGCPRSPNHRQGITSSPAKSANPLHVFSPKPLARMGVLESGFAEQRQQCILGKDITLATEFPLRSHNTVCFRRVPKSAQGANALSRATKRILPPFQTRQEPAGNPLCFHKRMRVGQGRTAPATDTP